MVCAAPYCSVRSLMKETNAMNRMWIVRRAGRFTLVALLLVVAGMGCAAGDASNVFDIAEACKDRRAGQPRLEGFAEQRAPGCVEGAEAQAVVCGLVRSSAGSSSQLIRPWRRDRRGSGATGRCARNAIVRRGAFP